jgi:hypothetical protein
MNKVTTVLEIGLALTLGSAAIDAATPDPTLAPAQVYRDRDYRDSHHDRDYRDREGELTGLRGIVDRTQTDLKAAAEFERGNGKQRQRFRDAQGHLSTLDKDLSKGKWGGDELNKSIDSIKSILDKNVLQASSRESILGDLEDLRIAKERHRH